MDLKSTKGGDDMTNTLELEIAIKRARMRKKDIAKLLGLSMMGLYKKTHNLSEFKASEISKLVTTLKISTLEEKEKIFFAT